MRHHVVGCSSVRPSVIRCFVVSASVLSGWISMTLDTNIPREASWALLNRFLRSEVKCQGRVQIN